MRRETMIYKADGLTLHSKRFVGEGEGTLPGVLVYPHGCGMDNHALGRAGRRAAMGFAALACDLHGGGVVISDAAAMLETKRRTAA